MALTPWGITKNTFAMYWFRARPNFGDLLSPALARAYTGLTPKWVTPGFQRKVLAVGSVLHALQPGDLVIGSGLLKPTDSVLPEGVRVLAVRGPLTAEQLGLDYGMVAFGDPGLLAARTLGIERDSTASQIGIIPHYWEKHDAKRLMDTSHQDNWTMIDVQQSPATVIREISRCRVCVSSSLHGLIIAESLGIPAIWASITGRLIGGNFKFDDYYLGTGRAQRAPLPLLEAVEAAGAHHSKSFTPDVSAIDQAMKQLALILRD